MFNDARKRRALLCLQHADYLVCRGRVEELLSSAKRLDEEIVAQGNTTFLGALDAAHRLLQEVLASAMAGDTPCHALDAESTRDELSRVP